MAAETFKTSNYRAMVDEVRGDLPNLEQTYYLGHRRVDAPCWPGPVSVSLGAG